MENGFVSLYTHDAAYARARELMLLTVDTGPEPGSDSDYGYDNPSFPHLVDRLFVKFLALQWLLGHLFLVVKFWAYLKMKRAVPAPPDAKASPEGWEEAADERSYVGLATVVMVVLIASKSDFLWGLVVMAGSWVWASVSAF